MPVADTLIRETLRLTSGGGVALRRNMDNAVTIGGKSIARGDFLAYLLEDVHFDASIYSDPYTFDPGRYEAGREEDKRAPFAYLGWGIGALSCVRAILHIEAKPARSTPLRWNEGREAGNESGAGFVLGGLRLRHRRWGGVASHCCPRDRPKRYPLGAS